MFENDFYWLIEKEERTLVYYYYNDDADCAGFGFNIADGGGFLPESDLLDSTEVVRFPEIIEFFGYSITKRNGNYDFRNSEGEGFIDVTEDKLRAIFAEMWQKVI